MDWVGCSFHSTVTLPGCSCIKRIALNCRLGIISFEGISYIQTVTSPNVSTCFPHFYMATCISPNAITYIFSKCHIFWHLYLWSFLSPIIFSQWIDSTFFKMLFKYFLFCNAFYIVVWFWLLTFTVIMPWKTLSQ